MNGIGRRQLLKLAGLTAVAGKGDTRPASTAPRRQVTAKDPTGLLAVAPSTVAAGEEFTVGVKVLTTPFTVARNCFTMSYPTVSSSTNVSPRGISYMDNVLPQWKGTLDIEAGPRYSGPSYVVADGEGPYPHDHRPIMRIGPCRIDSPGIHFVTFRDAVTGLTIETNPICVVDRRNRNRSRDDARMAATVIDPACSIAEVTDDKLFWGDIHGHTVFTDGIRSPEEVYCFARDEAFLDICALSDHTEFYLTDRQWEYLSDVANDFNQPGHFVTLLAQEWTNFNIGHRNIYHPGASAPFIRASDPYWGQLPRLFEFARAHGALVVPHHPAAAAMGVDWSLAHDPEVERLVEIYSCWGSSERSKAAGNPRSIKQGLGGEKAGSFVVDALRLGRKYGIIASGDVHDGRMGDALHGYQVEPANYKDTQPGGLIGVWAKELSREAVFDALWNRRVYGTTGARIILQFSIDGHPMGSIFTCSGESAVEVRVASEVPVSRVDLVRNGDDCQGETPDLREFVWQTRVAPASLSDAYYVRIVRADGHMAWSSPIWVEVS